MRTRRIRAATSEDARAIAEVHVASWRAAYRSLVPDAYLERLSVDDREAQRREHLDDSSGEFGTLVAEEDGHVVGFAAFGPSRDEDAPPGTGEVPAIYLDPAVIGTGIGRVLFAEATAGLRDAGYGRATLWVLEANERARRFYEKAGWTRDGATSTNDFDCANEPMIRYAADLS